MADKVGFINLFSLFYLSFIVTLIMGVNENDELRKIIHSTLRRWIKLLGAITVIIAVVLILDHI